MVKLNPGFTYSSFNRHVLRAALSLHLVCMCRGDRNDNIVVPALEELTGHRGHDSLIHK